MQRVQMFDTPHKALRMALGELLVLAGKTDFSNSSNIRGLQGLMRYVSTLIHSHSHVEDDLLFAALDHFTPAATKHDRAEHVRLHARLDELLATLRL